MIDVYTFCCEIYLKKHGLILMNFKMPAMNGFEATRKICEKFIYLYCYYDAYILDRGYTSSFGGEHNAIYFKTAFFVTIEKDCQNIYV